MVPKSRTLGKKKAVLAPSVQQALDPILAILIPLEVELGIPSSQRVSKGKGKLPAEGPSH